jgi:hypothetical protein
VVRRTVNRIDADIATTKQKRRGHESDPDLARGQGDLDKIVASLVEVALESSGDNVTVAMVVVDDEDGSDDVAIRRAD